VDSRRPNISIAFFDHGLDDALFHCQGQLQHAQRQLSDQYGVALTLNGTTVYAQVDKAEKAKQPKQGWTEHDHELSPQRDANERGREVGGLRQSVLSLRTQLDDARNCVLGRLLRNYTSSSRWERGAITILTLYLHACTDLAHGYLHCFSSGRLWIYPRRVRGDRTQSAPLCGG
jgi:hypothetical protein